MRYLLIVKATAQSETGEFPEDTSMFQEVADYNNQLIAAGVLLDGAGLKPSSAGVRIRDRKAGKAVVIDGPFAETKELIAGFWVLQCRDWDEALHWAKLAPDHCGELELRAFYEPEDFAGVISDEIVEQEKGWRDAAEARAPKAP